MILIVTMILIMVVIVVVSVSVIVVVIEIVILGVVIANVPELGRAPVRLPDILDLGGTVVVRRRIHPSKKGQNAGNFHT